MMQSLNAVVCDFVAYVVAYAVELLSLHIVVVGLLLNSNFDVVDDGVICVYMCVYVKHV